MYSRHEPCPEPKSSASTKQILAVSDIHLLHGIDTDRFENGATLSYAVKLLISNEIQPTDFPPIRVVNYKGLWYSLDSRRLFVFKNAMIDNIVAIICDYSNASVREEFEQKKQYKPIKSSILGDSKQHQAAKSRKIEGHYTYLRHILKWDFAKIAKPLPCLECVDPLPNRFINENDYYKSFMPLILEESRAILQHGMEQANKNTLDKIDARLAKLTFANKHADLSAIKLQIIKQKKPILIKPGDVFLLKNQSLHLLGIANYNANMLFKQKIVLQIVLSEKIKTQYNELKKNKQNYWQVYHLTSLTTQLRMYEACYAKQNLQLLRQIVKGNSQANGSSFSENPSSISADSLPHTLNESQRKVIEAFIHMGQGIQLVQGPPGTGKTTTIIELLRQISQTKCKILVTAPSNKAIQILAEKFAETQPNAPFILVAVEDKLPVDKPHLKKIFIHTWKKQITAELECLIQLVKDLNFQLTSAKQSTVNSYVDCISKAQIIITALEEDITKTLAKVEIYLSTLTDSKRLKESCITGLNGYRNIIDQLAIEDIQHPTLLIKSREPASILLSTFTLLQLIIAKQKDEDIEALILQHSIVIFATMSVCGRRSLNQLQAVDILIMDEAEQALEAESLIPLQFNPKKCLIVGDTKQLAATLFSNYLLNLKFDRSLLKRLIEDCKQPYYLLDIQYRMHPEISNWPNTYYYKGEIKNYSTQASCLTTNLQLQMAPSFLYPYSFINVNSRETQKHKANHSYSNVAEVLAINNIINYLLKQHSIDIKRQVSILTFYKEQIKLFKKILYSNHGDLNVNTVDSFQGEENDIIIISFVRSNLKGNIGFLSDFRRLNVALTRARSSLIMIGHAPTLKKSHKDLYDLLENANGRGKYFEYSTLKKFLEPDLAQSLAQQNYPMQLATLPDKKVNPKKSLNKNMTPGCLPETRATKQLAKHGEGKQQSKQPPNATPLTQPVSIIQKKPKIAKAISKHSKETMDKIERSNTPHNPTINLNLNRSHKSTQFNKQTNKRIGPSKISVTSQKPSPVKLEPHIMKAAHEPTSSRATTNNKPSKLRRVYQIKNHNHLVKRTEDQIVIPNMTAPPQPLSFFKPIKRSDIAQQVDTSSSNLQGDNYNHQS